jgi:rhodanese-like protein
MFESMKNVTMCAAAVAFAAATASAQYKSPQAAPPSNPGAVQVAPNNNIQVLTSSTPAEDDLSLAKRIPRDEAMKMVKEGKAVWIDVRAEAQFDEGHIPGALNFPLSEITSKLTQLPPRKFLITYCA